MMNEDQADMWKKAPTKEEWVEWGMAAYIADYINEDLLPQTKKERNDAK